MILNAPPSVELLIVGIMIALGIIALFLLLFFVIKGILYIGFGIFKFTISITVKIIDILVNIISFPFKIHHNDNITRNENRFCPYCGEHFDNGMEAQLHQQGRCFCRNCGELATI